MYLLNIEMGILNSSIITLILRNAMAYEFSGDATYYGGAGVGGSCSSSYIPSGFTTVAMNNDQYDNGLVCGSCIEGVYHLGGESIYFDAIVDNLCPECSFGDLDLGESGDGRWDLEWSFTECPSHDLIITSQGSNSFYGKIKVEGSGNVKSVSINGMETMGTPDGYWTIEDSSGSLGCGPKADILLGNGDEHSLCLDPALFGGDCSGDKCSVKETKDESEEEPEEESKDESKEESKEEPKDESEEEDVEIFIGAPVVDGTSNKCSKAFEQCGGKSYDGPKCCEEPYECIFVNEFYSHCIYVDDEGDTCQDKWKQCAGIGWSGATCCKRGFECVFKNDWYSHCL